MPLHLFIRMVLLMSLKKMNKFADLPKWVLANKTTKKNISSLYQGVTQGSRNDTLARLSGKWLKDLSYEDTIEMAMAWNQNNQPPMDFKEVVSVVGSIHKRDQNSINSFLSLKGDVGKETNFNPISAEELLSQPDEPINWVWETMIPEGSLFLLSAFMKVGKSELAYRFAVAITQGVEFLGMAARRTGVLILAVEEHPRDVKRRLRRLGLEKEDNLFILTGRIMNSPTTISKLREFIQENDIGLVLIDTISRFWNVKDENNNQEIIREVSPLLDLAHETNTAVGLLVHDRKSGGEDGRSIRGASSFFGLVDQAILLDRRQGGTTTQRTVKTLGRYAESPRELLIDLVENEYTVLGTPEEVGRLAALTKVQEALGVDSQDVKAIAEETGLTQKEVRRTLEELREKGKAIRGGEGKRGSPYTYRRPSHSDSFLSQPTSIGEETNIEEISLFGR